MGGGLGRTFATGRDARCCTAGKKLCTEPFADFRGSSVPSSRLSSAGAAGKATRLSSPGAVEGKAFARFRGGSISLTPSANAGAVVGLAVESVCVADACIGGTRPEVSAGAVDDADCCGCWKIWDGLILKRADPVEVAHACIGGSWRELSNSATNSLTCLGMSPIPSGLHTRQRDKRVADGFLTVRVSTMPWPIIQSCSCQDKEKKACAAPMSTLFCKIHSSLLQLAIMKVKLVQSTRVVSGCIGDHQSSWGCEQLNGCESTVLCKTDVEPWPSHNQEFHNVQHNVLYTVHIVGGCLG